MGAYGVDSVTSYGITNARRVADRNRKYGMSLAFRPDRRLSYRSRGRRGSYVLLIR